jgi:hypothetical protein
MATDPSPRAGGGNAPGALRTGRNALPDCRQRGGPGGRCQVRARGRQLARVWRRCRAAGAGRAVERVVAAIPNGAGRRRGAAAPMGSRAGSLAGRLVIGVVRAGRRPAESPGGEAGFGWRSRGSRRRPDGSGTDCALRLSGRHAARQAALRAGRVAVRPTRAGSDGMSPDARHTGRHLRLLLAFAGRILWRLHRARPSAREPAQWSVVFAIGHTTSPIAHSHAPT